MTKAKTPATRKIDWPMVALYLGSGLLFVYAMEHVPWERVEHMPIERIAVIATAIVSTVTGLIAGFRGKTVETIATRPVTLDPRADETPPEAP